MALSNSLQEKKQDFFRKTGPSLPYGLHKSAMAESPDGRGVILFGGASYENYYKKEYWNYQQVQIHGIV